MNPAHIEHALLKEIAARKRRVWTIPLILCLLPAALGAFVGIAAAVARLGGLPLNAHYLPVDFHRLDVIALASGWGVNIAMQIVVLFYLCRSLHNRDGRDEALFWKEVGLTPGEVVTVRILFCTVALPLIAAVLTTLVPASLGLVDVVAQIFSGGPALASAANLLVETPTLALLSFTAFLAEALWLLPLYGYLLVVSGASRGYGHPVMFALLGWLALLIVGGFVPPFGHWLSALGRDDPFAALVRFKPHDLHVPMLLLNVALGLALLPLAARLYARLER